MPRRLGGTKAYPKIIQLRVPANLKDAIDEAAEARFVPVPDFIRFVIIEYLEARQRWKILAEQGKIADNL